MACDKCEKKFKLPRELKVHRFTEHDISDSTLKVKEPMACSLAIVFDLSIQSLEAAFVRCIEILWTLFVVDVSRTVLIMHSRVCDCSK